MNDTVATEDQEQPAGCHQRKARVADRDPGRRTSSGPADTCSAPTEAGHMTAADQIVRSAKKVLAMEGRPHMTTLAPILISFSFKLVSATSFGTERGGGPKSDSSAAMRTGSALLEERKRGRIRLKPR